VLLALSRNLVDKDDTVICLSGSTRCGTFDTIVALDITAEYQFFFSATNAILPPDVKPEVLERVLALAGEIAVEGREGKPLGTIFVVGDTNTVNAYIRQLIINPFRGYSEAERNILDPALGETIKEFAAIDGAFVITGDGVVLSAGSYLRPQREVEDLPSGLGSRHAAAAGITACTSTLAITVSESTGMVSVFKNGSIMMTISRPLEKEKGIVQKMMM
jgi:DNA integrity scanning protein DisA with diadenylate cyclase activity